MSECRACGGDLRHIHTYETPRATHESVKCRACGRAGLRSIGLAPTVRRFGQAFASRSLNPGGRSAQHPDAATNTTLPPGRTDRGGAVTDGGISADELTECWCCGTVSERPRCPDCRAASCDHFGGECLVDGEKFDKQTIDSSTDDE